MKRLLRSTAIVLMALFSMNAGAQTTYSPEDQVRSINKHFLGEQLQGIAEYEPQRYEAIQFYFKSSFSVSLLECPGCKVDMHEFHVRDQFDVTQFESQRLMDEAVEILYKEKYKVVLMSKNDLSTHINSMDLDALVSRKIHRPFPVWNLEGTQQDFAEYMKLVKGWQRDFPDEFKAMYYSEGFVKLHYSEFQQLSEAEQNEILTNQSGYLLLGE